MDDLFELAESRQLHCSSIQTDVREQTLFVRRQWIDQLRGPQPRQPTADFPIQERRELFQTTNFKALNCIGIIPLSMLRLRSGAALGLGCC